MARKFREVDFPPDQELVFCDVGKRLYLLKSKHLKIKKSFGHIILCIKYPGHIPENKTGNFHPKVFTEIGHHLLLQ